METKDLSKNILLTILLFHLDAYLLQNIKNDHLSKNMRGNFLNEKLSDGEYQLLHELDANCYKRCIRADAVLGNISISTFP